MHNIQARVIKCLFNIFLLKENQISSKWGFIFLGIQKKYIKL